MPVHYIYYVLMAFALVVLVYRVFKSSGHERWQAMVVTFSGVIAAVGNFLFALRLHILQGINLTPIALAISVSLLYLAIKRYNLLDIASLASKHAVQTMPDAFIIIDHNENVLESNNAAFNIFSELQNLDEKPVSLKNINKWPNELKQIINAEAAGSEHSTVDFSFDNGSVKHYRANISRIYAQKALQGWSVLIQDISDIVELMNKLEIYATTDALTGLYNRRYFSEHSKMRFDECMRMEEPISVIIFDIDFFKSVNDTYGHAGGDAVLAAVSDISKKQLRAYDLIARYGGEEFAVLLPNTGAEKALEIAERLRKSVENHTTQFLNSSINCTISLGVAVSNDDCPELERLIDKADNALYCAKLSGRNRVEIDANAQS